MKKTVPQKCLPLLLIACVIAFPCRPASAEYRSWTGKNGIAVEAELIGITDDSKFVSLRSREGRITQGAVDKLSEEDQQFIREYENDQKAKGMVKFRNRWMSPGLVKDIKRREQEAKYHEYAHEMAMSKAKWRVPFKILQALPDGALCIRGEHVAGYMFYTEELFFLIGATRRTVADDEEYIQDLYWAGTYTYTTVEGNEKTVNSYSFDLASAMIAIRVKFDLYDEEEVEPETTSPAWDIAISEPALADPDLKGFGSGFIITPDGFLLTNHHVVKDAIQVKVKTEKEILPAQIVAQDIENDIALLKINGKYEPVTFSAKNIATLGETVFTVGFPMPDLQGFSPKITKGIISSLNGIQDDVRMYQIDAAVQRGNSGGPLADEKGNIVGIVVASMNEILVAQTTGSLPQNINYAIKKSYILELVQKNPEASKQIQTEGRFRWLSFEDSVERVQKATVLVMVY